MRQPPKHNAELSWPVRFARTKVKTHQLYRHALDRSFSDWSELPQALDRWRAAGMQGVIECGYFKSEVPS